MGREERAKGISCPQASSSGVPLSATDSLARWEGFCSQGQGTEATRACTVRILVGPALRRGASQRVSKRGTPSPPTPAYWLSLNLLKRRCALEVWFTPWAL